MTPGRVGGTYVLSGRAKLGANGKLLAEPDSMSPVGGLTLFVDDPEGQGAKQCLKTDEKGMLYPLAKSGAPRKTAAHFLPRKDRVGKKRVDPKMRVYLPPPELLLNAWARNHDNWADALAKALEKAGSSLRGTEVAAVELEKSALRPPDRGSTASAEKSWAKLYDSLPAKAKLPAWILPRVRALVMILPPALSQGSTVRVTPEGKSPIACALLRHEGKTYAVASGDEKSLPAGMYAFEVGMAARSSTTLWSAAIGREGKYRLKEQVRFGITNFAGEFELINCAPISVEEAVLQQFPTLYWHRIELAKKRSDLPEIDQDPDYKDFPKALEQWADRLEWAEAKAKLTVGMINASGWQKRARILGKLVWKQLKPPADDELLSATRNSVDLGFQLWGQRKEWRELLEGMEEAKEAEKELAVLKQWLWADAEKPFAKYRWWEFAKNEFISGDKEWRVLELASATETERKAILAAGIPERTNLETLIGSSAGSAVQKGVVAAQLAIDVYKTALAFNEVLQSLKDENDLVRDLDKLFSQFDQALGRSACREAIGNLERLRAATVAAHRKADDAEAQALMTGIDAALGVLSLAFPPLQVLVLVKESASLGKEIVVEAAEWLDRTIAKGWAADVFARTWTQLAELARGSGANQELMPQVGADGGADDLNIQLRLRAEAVHGLVGLLTRAGVASKDEKGYLERVAKYRVTEYIQHYLLDDGWQLPTRPLVPVGMDAAWLYLTSSHGIMATESAVAQQLGFAAPLKAAAVGLVPFGMTMLTVVDSALAGNAVARFQKPFPIHCADSAVSDLALAFRTAWKELDAESVEYTCIYRRPADSTANTDWRAVNSGGVSEVDQLELLSPFDQIRILVVFKKSVSPGCYPLSVQLYRTDGVNIAGPVYRDITCRLDKGTNLLPEEKDFDGRIGCVLHPFYQLGSQMIAGIKPMSRTASWTGASLYQTLGYLDDMKYGFRIKTGDSSEPTWMKIGAGKARSSALDEVRVGITGKPHEESLLVADFLDSHSQKTPLPLLFQLTRGFGPCYVRVGNRRYELATPDEGARLTYDNYDWNNDPVEFVVVAYATSLAYADWERLSLDWSRVPVTMELVNFHTLGTDRGPTYSSTLNYLGRLSTQHPSLNAGTHPLDPELQPWASQLKDPAELKKLVDGVDPRNFGSLAEKQSEYHLFAARFAIDYFLPSGGHLKRLRPFGRLLTGAGSYYRIGLRNLQAAQASNLEQTQLEAPVSKSWTSAAGYLMPEYEFRFAAPRSHDSGVPWATLKEADREEWIKKQSTKRNPNVELIAK